jgi:RNA polymerase sigma-70 factor (ECF subfamily)
VISDREIVRRVLGGDGAAFDELFERYFTGLFRFALPRVHYDPDTAEEVVQAALCAALRKLHTFRGEAALFTWLCTFCRREISAHYERSRRQPPVVALVDETTEVAMALESLWSIGGVGPEEAVWRHELGRLVHVALDALPAHYGDALEWKYIEEIPVNEIAVRLAVTPKAAESLLSRAREAFRDAFSTLVRHRFA